jgi:hypothetical protein
MISGCSALSPLCPGSIATTLPASPGVDRLLLDEVVAATAMVDRVVGTDVVDAVVGVVVTDARVVSCEGVPAVVGCADDVVAPAPVGSRPGTVT